MARFTIVWLDRESKVRRQATRSSEAAARELARQLTEEGHTDVRYRHPGERQWRAVRAKGVTSGRRKREIPFPATAKAMKERRLRDERGSDALDRRLPGSFESGR